MTRLDKYRHIARATFAQHQRGVAILGTLAVVALAGVTLTGIWLFFAHAPDPGYTGYQPGAGTRLDEEPQTVVSQLHDVFATVAGVIALTGTAWFAYRVSHRIPTLGVVGFAVVVFGSLLGGAVRFNIVEFEDQPLSAADSGYVQVFSRDLEYAVTAVGQVGPQLFQLIVLSHVATVPLLVAYAALAISRAIDRRHEALLNEPKRTWFTRERPT